MGDPKEKQIRQYYIEQGYEGQALDDAVKDAIEYQAKQTKQPEPKKQTVEPLVAKGGNNQISNIKINPENKDEAFVEFSAPPIKVPELVNGDLPDIKERELFYTQGLQKKGFKGEELQKRLDFALNRDRERYNQKVQAANKQIQDSQPKPVANKGGWGDETDDWAITSLAKNAWNNALIPLINNLGSIPEVATNFIKTGYNLEREIAKGAEGSNMRYEGPPGIAALRLINDGIEKALPYVKPFTDVWEKGVAFIGKGWNDVFTPLTKNFEFKINPDAMNPFIKPSKGYTEETFSILDMDSWEVDSFGKWAGSIGQGIGSTGSIFLAAGAAKLFSKGKVSPALASFMAGSLTETNGIMQNLMENHDMSREEAMAIAGFAGPIIGTVDVLFGVENIAAKGFFREIVEDEILKTLKGYAGKKLVASQFKEIGTAIGRGVTKRMTPKLLNSAVQMGVEGVTEGAQSGIEKGIYQLVDNYLGYEKKTGEKLFDKVMSGQSLTGFELNAKAYVDMINEAAIGGIASGPFTAIHMMTSPSEQQTLFNYIESQVRSGKDPRGRLAGLIDDQRAGLSDQEKTYARENVQEMYNVAEAFKGVKGTSDAKFQMYSLAKEKVHLQSKINEFQAKEQELASRISELEDLVNNPPVPPTVEEVATYQAQNAAAVAELAQRQAEYEQHVSNADDVNLYSENIALIDGTAKNVAKTGTVDITYETNKKALEEKYKKTSPKPADSTAAPAEEKPKKKSQPAWKAKRSEGYMRGRIVRWGEGIGKQHIKDDDGDWFVLNRTPGSSKVSYKPVNDAATIKNLNDIFDEEAPSPVETPTTETVEPIVTPPTGTKESPVSPTVEPIVTPPPAPATKYKKNKDVVLTEGETHAITFLDEEGESTDKSITIKQKFGNQYVVEDETGKEFLVQANDLQNDIFEQDQSGASADFGVKYTPTNKKPAQGKKDEAKPSEVTQEAPPAPKEETKSPAADKTKIIAYGRWPARNGIFDKFTIDPLEDGATPFSIFEIHEKADGTYTLKPLKDLYSASKSSPDAFREMMDFKEGMDNVDLGSVGFEMIDGGVLEKRDRGRFEIVKKPKARFIHDKKETSTPKTEEPKPAEVTQEEPPAPKEETKSPAADKTKEDEVRARIAEKKARLKKLNDERNAPKIMDDPKRNAEMDIEMLSVATEMIGDYIELGKIKFKDIINDIIAEDGRNFAEQIFNYIKKAYAAYYQEAADDVADQMDDAKTVRGSKFEDFAEQEEIKEEQDNQPIEKPKTEKQKTEKSAIPKVGEKTEEGEYAYNPSFHEAVDNNAGDVIVGKREYNMPLADGDTIQYTHVLADAALILPSHDPRGHVGIGTAGTGDNGNINVSSLDPTDGYPERDGKSANSREYNTKSVIEAMFEHAYDLIAEYLLGSKTAAEGEPIITDDGVVISGNSRMMSLWVAIERNKDKKTKVKLKGNLRGVDGNYDRYLAALKKEIEESPAKYEGITVEQIDEMVARGKHPVLVKKTSNIKEYSKTEFDRYNQTLTQSKTEEERAKTTKDAIDSATIEQKNKLSELFYMVDDSGVASSIKDILSSKSKAQKIADLLSEMGLLSKADYAKYLHNGIFNTAGIEHVTSLLRGIILTDETLELFLNSKVDDEFGLKHFVKNIERALPALLYNYLIDGDANIVDWLIAAVQLKTYHYNQGVADNYISVPRKRGIEQKDNIDGFIDMRIRQSESFPTGDDNDVFFNLMKNEANRLFVTAFFAAAGAGTKAFASTDLTKLVQSFNNEYRRGVGEKILEETVNIFSDTEEDIVRKEALDAIETLVATYYPQLLLSKIADPNTPETEKEGLKRQTEIHNKKTVSNIYDNLIKQGLSIDSLEKFARDTFGGKGGVKPTEPVSTKEQKDNKGQEKTDRGNTSDTDAGVNQSDIKNKDTESTKDDQADINQGREPKSGTGTGEKADTGTDSTKQAGTGTKTGATENQEKSAEIDKQIESKIDAIKDILGDIINPNKIGIYNDPKLDAEQNIKLGKLVTELVPLYIQKGYYAFKDMFLSVYNTYGEQIARILHPFLADSYMGYQTQIDDDAILDKMQSAREIKKETADKLISEVNNADKIDEQTTPPTHRIQEEKAIADNKKARAYNGDKLNDVLYSFEEEARVASANNEAASNEKLKSKTSIGVVEVSFDKAKDRLSYKKEDGTPLTPNEVETFFVEIVQGKSSLQDGSGTTVFAPKETISNNEAQAQYRAEVREALKKDKGVSKDIADDTISVESVYKMADKAGVMPADFHKNIKQAILDKTGYTAETYSEILKKPTNGQKEKTDKSKQKLQDESKPSSGGTVRGNTSRGVHPERPPIVYAAKSQIPSVEKQIKDSEYTYLDEHQRFGVNLILSRFFNKGRGFFLADGPGVGKTAVLLAVAHVMSKKGKVLIVTQSKDIINDSFKDDAIGLGIDPKKSGITITTYNDIKALDKDGNMKYSNTDFELVIYDEAHKLKNSHTATAIASFNIKSNHVLFSSATPMDKPTGAVYFMSQILGLSEDEIYNRIGLQVSSYRDKDGVSKRKVTLLKGTSPQQVAKKLQMLALSAVREGAMLRREFPFWGTIEEVALIPNNIVEILQEEAEIRTYWESRPRTAGQMYNELRRWNESKKVEAIWQVVMEELEAGRKVVVFANFYTQSLIKALGKEVPMFITLFTEKAESMGIPIAKLWSAHDVTVERERFQNGEVSIALGTFGSAATGVQADDRVGDAPRTLILVTPPYAGDLMQQAVGRVSRKLSQSPAKAIIVYMPGTSDSHAMGIMKKKIMTLEAMQKAGAELGALAVTDDFLNEIEGGEAEVGSTELIRDAPKTNDLNTKQLDADNFIVYGTGTYHNRHAIKSLGGRYNGFHKAWIFPLSERARVERELGIREEAKFQIAPERGKSYSPVSISGRGKPSEVEDMAKRKAKEKNTVEGMKPEEREKYMIKRKAKVLKMAAFLNKVFPKIKLRIASKAEFYAKFKKAIDEGRVKLDSIGGVKEGDEVWINIDAIVTNELTAVHEFAHVFTAIMKEYMNKTYLQGLELVRGTVYHQYAISTHSGVYKTEEDFLEEALVLAIEDMGSQILSRTLYRKFVQWARNILNRIGRRIGFVKGLSLADMSLNDFTRLIAERMLSGSEISLKEDVSDEIYAQMQIFGEPIEAPDIVVKKRWGILSNPRFSYIGAGNIFSNKSKDVIKNAYKMALAMAAKGKTSEEIRLATGWFRNPFDKKWRYEIGDREMSFKNDETSLLKISNATEASPVKLSDVIKHDKLFALFPELKDIVIAYKQGDTDYHASMSSDGNRITVALPFFSVTNGQQLAILLHEIQHGIQIREGLAMGASPEQMTDILANLLGARAKAMQPLLRHTEYPLAFIRIGEYYNALKEILGNKEMEAIFEKTYRTTVQAEINSIEDTINGYDSAGIVDYQGRSAREYLGKSGRFYSLETSRAAKTRLQYADAFIDNENLNRKYRAVSTGAPLSSIREMYYMATAGEIEARDVEARMFMTEEERMETPPYSTEDYEADEAITYFGTEEDVDFAEDLVGFRPSITQKEPKFSIIGETGAAKMQNASAIIADLSVAKKMTNAGKDAKTIRLATGWEKGVDGKWYFETKDIYFNNTHNVVNVMLSEKESSFILSDILSADDIFEAYPKLKDYKIKFVTDTENKNFRAVYDESKKTITINTEDFKDQWAGTDISKVVRALGDLKGMRKLISHELTHAIQHIEGFATGGGIDIFKDISSNRNMAIEQLEAINKRLKDNNYKGTTDEYKDKRNKEIIEKLLALPQWISSNYERYKALAGENVAYSVAKRVGMTPEERRNTLLSETEDVAREQQIVLMDALGGQENAKFSITPSTIKAQAIANGTFMKAPNGKPTNLNERQWLQVRTPEFKAWFGDWENDPKNASKVVDENGEPMVVYHSTKEKNIEQFKTEGNIETLGGVVNNYGSYWTPKPDYKGFKGDEYYSAFLSIKNPLITTDQIYSAIITRAKKYEIKKNNYDGVILNRFGRTFFDEIIAFEPNQIKSATDNTGTFSPDTNDIRFSITPSTTPAGTSTTRFYIPNGMEISDYLGRQERNAYHGALSTMNHASIIAQMRTDLDVFVQAYITNNIGTAKRRAMLTNFYDDAIMLEVAQTITDPLFTPSKEAGELYSFIFRSDTDKPSQNLFGAINHFRLNENYSFLGVHERISHAADVTDVATQQEILNRAKSGVTRFILNRKKYLIAGQRIGKYIQQRMIDLFNFTTVSKWFSTATGTLAKFDQLIKDRNLIAGKLKARNNQLFELALDEFSRYTAYRGVNNYTSVKKIEVLNARDGKIYKMPVDYVISLIQMHESFVDHWARMGKNKTSPLIDSPSSGETDGFVFQDFDDPTIQRILRVDDAEYIRLQDEINNTPEYSAMYHRIEGLFNRNDIFDYLSQTYSHNTGLKLPRVAKYFPLTAITDTNAEMELRNITGLLEETSIIKPRTGPAKQYRLMGAMSAMKAHYETVEDFVQNQEVILNISNYLNKNEKTLKADTYNQPELIEYLTNFMKDLNNWRRQVYEQNKDQQNTINIPKLLSKFALSRFAWNFGMPLIQAFGYFPALMQGVIKDKYLILAGKDLSYLIARAYTDSVLLAGEKEKLPIVPISTGEAKLMDEIRHNVFASELYLRLHQTNPDVDLTPLTEINPRSASTVAGAAMQTWNWLINTVADKYGMSFMRRGDRAPILTFYKAAQYQFDAESTGGILDGMNRDEWVADKATKLMYATNQLYPINQRTGFQRRKDIISKMIGLFSGQQQKQLNLALQSYADYLVSPTTENKWRLTGAIGFGIIFSAFGTAFVHALAKGLRDSIKPKDDDDDDEKQGELLFDYFRTDLIRNLSGNIPGLPTEIFNTIVSYLDQQYWTDKPVDIPPITAITESALGFAEVMAGLSMGNDGSVKSEYMQKKTIHNGLLMINRNVSQLIGFPFEFARQIENTVLYSIKPEKPRAKSKKAF